MCASRSIRPGVNLQMIRIAYAVDFGFQLTSDVFPADADTNDFAYATVNHLDDENPNMSISAIQLRKENVASSPVVLETVVENSRLKEWKFRFLRGKDTINETGEASMVAAPELTLELSFQDLFDSVSKWETADHSPSPGGGSGEAQPPPVESRAESAEAAE